MRGNFYAYDVTVPALEVPWMDPCDVTTICKDRFGKSHEYYSFENATIGPQHYRMEKGWDRYQQVLDHEKACKPMMLELARKAFPELAAVDQWPTLWVEIPGLDASHATVEVTI